MRISDVIGLLSAFIGSTATLFGAWAYIRSQHPSKGELLRAALVIIVMMAAVAGLAMGISRATTITVNGRDSIPVPHPFSSFSTPANSSPSPAPSSPLFFPSPTLSPSPTVSPSPSPTVSPAPASTSSPSPTSLPSPTPTP